MIVVVEFSLGTPLRLPSNTKQIKPHTAIRLQGKSSTRLNNGVSKALLNKKSTKKTRKTTTTYGGPSLRQSK